MQNIYIFASMTHNTLRKLEAFWSRDYKGLWVQSVHPATIVIMRGGQCVDSVELTHQEGQFLHHALGATSPLQPIHVFIVALHQGYWPVKARPSAAPSEQAPLWPSLVGELSVG
jgi:hypothetical protein